MEVSLTKASLLNQGQFDKTVIYSPFLTSQKINQGKGFVKSDSNLAL